MSIIACAARAQELKTKNIIIITLDGYRWQEVFEGADTKILNDKKYAADKKLVNEYTEGNEQARRQMLMPFFWGTIARQGQLYGNRNFKNKVNCSNNHLLSYPGYSEMLVGFNARTVRGNTKKDNPNATVLEYINKSKNFRGKVAAFATWDVFSFILRKQQVNFYVNAGSEPAQGKLSDREKFMNSQLTSGYRSDDFTFDYAMEYLKRERPKVLFIGFDETDAAGHDGKYDRYLRAANEADRRIEQLWNWVQSQPDYKDQTTVLITTDHGRGKGVNSWQNHRLLAAGSRHIWFAIIGPDSPAFGEVKFKGKYYQNQAAKTIAAFLGMNYQPKKPAGDVIQTMLGVPQPSYDNVYSQNFTGKNSPPD
jgi:hypothetical protein